MVAPGIFTSVKVEIQFVPGQWSDVSGDVALEEGVHIDQGRATEQEDIAPGVLKFTLRNDTGKYTPNNPTSALFPYVTEGRPVRMSVVKSAVTYRRYTGTIAVLEPAFPDDDSTTGTVVVNCIDVLGSLHERRLLAPHVEETVRVCRNEGVQSDVYTFHKRSRTSARAPIYFTNYGYLGDGYTNSNGYLRTLPGNHGGLQLSTPDGLNTDAAIDLLPRIKYATGPALKCVPGGTISGDFRDTVVDRVEFWFKIPSSYVQPAGTNGTIADLWHTTARGVGPATGLWSVRVYTSASLMRIAIYDNTGAFFADLVDDDGQSYTSINDDAWHKMTMVYDAGDTRVWIDDLGDSGFYTTAFNDISLLDIMYLGGSVRPGRESHPFNSPVVSYAAVSMTGTSTGIGSAYLTGIPSITDARTRYYELLGYANKFVTQRLATPVVYTTASNLVTCTDPIFSTDDIGAGLGANTTDIPNDTTITAINSPTVAVMSWTATHNGNADLLVGPKQIGQDIRTVARVPTTDSGDMQSAFQDLARTWAGYAWVDVYGNITLIHPDAINSTTPLVSLDLEGDALAEELELKRGIETVPTRVTVSGPIGDVIYVDFATEGGLTTGSPFRQEMGISAGTWCEGEAFALGGFYATQSRGLRIVKIGVDLVMAQTDLYSTFLTAGNLRPGVRLRGTGLPTAVFGQSSTDVVVQGWTEDYDETSAIFTFDLTPANDPVQGVWDDAEFGRWAAGDTALDLGYSLTSGATALVVAPGDNSGVTVTTAAGDYPLDLDILGERVTSAGVPGTLARTNLVTNPSFEVNTTGWAGAGAATIARTAIAKPRIDGTWAGLVTWPTVGALGSSVGYAFAVTSGTTYTFSVYVNVPAGNPRVQVGERSNLGNSVSYSLQDTTGFNNAWVRLGVTLTAASTTTYNFVVRNLDASVSGQVCFIDAVLLEATTRGQGSYFDGSNGGTWTGSADASTSTQTAQTFTVTRGVSPTVARAHSASETVDIYHAMTWAI